MEAPLVCLDEEFDDLRPCHMDELDHPALSHSSYSTTTVPLATISREDFSELENFSEMMSFKSMEDLVNEFDEKLNVCFHNYNTKTEVLAPIRNQSHNQEDEERLQDEEWVHHYYTFLNDLSWSAVLVRRHRSCPAWNDVTLMSSLL